MELLRGLWVDSTWFEGFRSPAAIVRPQEFEGVALQIVSCTHRFKKSPCVSLPVSKLLQGTFKRTRTPDLSLSVCVCGRGET